MRWPHGAALSLSLSALFAVCTAMHTLAYGQDVTPPAGNPPVDTPPDEPADQDVKKEPDQDDKLHWLDKTHKTLYDTMWRSAEHVDRWFGSVADDAVYQQVYGSIAPTILYTQYDGLRTHA